MSGILSYGAYVPYFRLQRAAIGAVLKGSGGTGTRAVASYDEDTTTMAVEAGRLALAAAPAGVGPRSLIFATTSPAYLDKTNAAAIHAALDFDMDVFAADMIGSVRTANAAVRSALDTSAPTLVTIADLRSGLPGSAEERDSGDAAVALLIGDGPVLAECIGLSSATGEFLDRWRVPGEPASRVWEERFGEHAYAPYVEAALQGLKEAGVSPEEIDHLIVAGLHARAVRAAVKTVGASPDVLVDDLTGSIGNTGAAHPGLLLADVLDRAQPGQTIAMVILADGCDVMVWRTTAALPSYRRAMTVEAQIQAGEDSLDYGTFLTWRGLLRREPPRRPDPAPPAGPPTLRAEPWKYAFTATRCSSCGMRHLPPQRVCLECHAVDAMVPERLAETTATIATHTVDRLAYSPSPPVIVGVLDFDGGGRYQCELTDVDAGGVAIGDRVEMTFRRMFTANGIHNYFWKARPIRGGS